eukprot:TRINITY_DN73_c1_g6_i1.p1 TRINITY_DN73_c1_g6~~TRINITY_DN73_c1_g6_i1.p1  ORF type:complete len:691 (-),score=217.22 TRINITY_DN73_c1_g6_i1:79-2151(-)
MESPGDVVIAFINGKSGGQQGPKVKAKLVKLLSADRVFDLSDGGPQKGLELFESVRDSLRIIVCGGDGTVCWVLGVMDKLNWDLRPPIAVLPLGTGNDMSRVLMWGPGWQGDSLEKYLNNVKQAKTIYLDRWQVRTLNLTPEEVKEKVDSFTRKSFHSDSSNEEDCHSELIESSKAISPKRKRSFSFPVLSTSKGLPLNSSSKLTWKLTQHSGNEMGRSAPLITQQGRNSLSEDELTQIDEEDELKKAGSEPKLYMSQQRLLKVPSTDQTKSDKPKKKLKRSDFKEKKPSIDNDPVKLNLIQEDEELSIPPKEKQTEEKTRSPKPVIVEKIKKNGKDSGSKEKMIFIRKSDKEIELDEIHSSEENDNILRMSAKGKAIFLEEGYHSSEERNRNSGKGKQIQIEEDSEFIRSDKGKEIDRSELEQDDKGKELISESKPIPKNPNENISVMNNYFSVGIDGRVCLDFHNFRNKNPELFRNRIVNYGWYGAVGLKSAITHWTPLAQVMTLKVDNQIVKLKKKLLALVVLNIPSYGGGADLWGGGVQPPWKEQDIGDGTFEVVGIKGAFHMGQIQGKLARGVKIAQGKKIAILCKKNIEAQIDGEPFKISPSYIKISKMNSSPFLLNSAKDKHGKAEAKLRGQTPLKKTTSTKKSFQFLGNSLSASSRERKVKEESRPLNKTPEGYSSSEEDKQ